MYLLGALDKYPQKFLDLLQRHTTLQQHGGDRVAEQVRIDTLGNARPYGTVAAITLNRLYLIGKKDILA